MADYFGGIDTSSKAAKTIVAKPTEGEIFTPGEPGSWEWIARVAVTWDQTEIVNLQKKLKREGFYDGPVNGNYDWKTQQAHRTYYEEGKPGSWAWISTLKQRWTEDEIKDLREFLGFEREIQPGEGDDLYGPMIQEAHRQHFEDKAFYGEGPAMNILKQRRKETKFGVSSEMLQSQEQMRGEIYSLIQSTTGVEPTYENVQFYFGKYGADAMLTMEEAYAMRAGLIKKKMAHFPGITEAMTPDEYAAARDKANTIAQRHYGENATDEEVSMLIRGQVPPPRGFNIGPGAINPRTELG